MVAVKFRYFHIVLLEFCMKLQQHFNSCRNNLYVKYQNDIKSERDEVDLTEFPFSCVNFMKNMYVPMFHTAVEERKI